MSIYPIPPNDMNERDVMPTTQPNIYLQALPAALDLVQLDQQDPDFAAHWLKQLFQEGPLQLQVNPSFPVGEKLQHLYFSARNHERVKGTSTLGFGYPCCCGHKAKKPLSRRFSSGKSASRPPKTVLKTGSSGIEKRASFPIFHCSNF